MSILISYKKGHAHKKLLIVLGIIAFLMVVWLLGRQKDSSPANFSSESNATVTSPVKKVVKKEPAFDKAKYSINDASSLWVVVNKGRILPSSYVPANLVTPEVSLRLGAASSEMHIRSDTAAALKSMFNAAQKDGVRLMLASGYRSYSEQIGLYAGYVKSQGQTAADASSARAGHSEHQTGLAADVEPASRNCEVDVCFAETAEGQWLAANAYKYGFIIRYEKGKDSMTGYEYEPWHVRYVGIELAAQIYASHQTLEEFLSLPAFNYYPVSSYQLQNK